MSKRFGRNQRRRAREQFAALEYEHGLLLTKSSMQDGSLHKAAKRVRELEQQLEHAKLVIGRHHPAFPPERLQMGYFPAPGEHFQLNTGPRDIASMALMSISTNRDTVFNEVHFFLTHGDKRAAYAVSLNALRAEEAEGELCWFITKALVGHIIDAYQQEKSRGRR